MSDDICGYESEQGTLCTDCDTGYGTALYPVDDFEDEPTYCDECNKVVQAGVIREILLGDHRGIYIPRDFVEGFDLSNWGLSESDEDVRICRDPEHEWYWEAWDAILTKAEHTDKSGHKWSLHQNGDLFAVRYVEP